MHPSVFLSALLFATSAIARPDLLRRDGTFRRNGILLNPQTGEAMSDYGDSHNHDGNSGAQAASASSVSAAAAASSLYAVGQSELSVASAIAASQSSAFAQQGASTTSSWFAKGSDDGIKWVQANRYGNH